VGAEVQVARAPTASEATIRRRAISAVAGSNFTRPGWWKSRAPTLSVVGTATLPPSSTIRSAKWTPLSP